MKKISSSALCKSAKEIFKRGGKSGQCSQRTLLPLVLRMQPLLSSAVSCEHRATKALSAFGACPSWAAATMASVKTCDWHFKVLLSLQQLGRELFRSKVKGYCSPNSFFFSFSIFFFFLSFFNLEVLNLSAENVLLVERMKDRRNLEVFNHRSADPVVS